MKPFSIPLQSSPNLLSGINVSDSDTGAALKTAVKRARDLLDKGLAASALAEFSKLSPALESRSDIPTVLRGTVYFLQGRALLATGQNPEAAKQLERAAENFRSVANTEASARFFVDYGECLRLLGKPDEAVHWLKPVTDDKELWGEATRCLAEAYEVQGRLEEAGACFERVGSFEKALEMYDAAIAGGGATNAALAVARARTLVFLNRNEEANAEAMRAFELDRSSADAWRFRAIGLLVVGQGEEALRILDEAAPIFPEDDNLLFTRAIVLVTLGRNQEALQPLERVLESVPNAVNALVLAARVELSLGNSTRSIELARKAVELQPEDVEVQEVLGVSYFTAGDTRAAKAHLKKAVELAPASPVALKYIDLLLQEEEWREALPAIEEALERHPDDLALLGRRVLCLNNLEQRQEAEQAARKLLAAKPQDAWILLQAGVALRLADRPSEAIEPLRNALLIKPDYPEAHFQLGEALRRTGEIEAAAKEVSIAMESMSKDARVVGTMGQIELARGRVPEAISLLKEALAIDRSLEWAWSDLADAQHAARNLEGALSAIERALLMDPKNPVYRQKKGWMLLDGGQPEAAAKEFALVAKAQPDSAFAWCNWGEALRRAGHWAEARKHLDKAVELGAQQIEIVAYRALLACDMAEYSDAIKLLRPWFDNGRRDAWAISVLGWAYENEDGGRGEEALVAYEGALEHTEGRVERLVELDLWNVKGKGNALRLLRRWEEASEAYRLVIEAAKRLVSRVSPESYALLGWCEYGRGKFDEAVRLLQSALSLDSGLLSVWFDLGLSLFCSAQWSLGLERYRHALKAVDSKEIEGRRGLLHVAWSDLWEAIRDDRVSGVNESVPEIQQTLRLLENSLDAAFSGTGWSRHSAITH